MSETTMLHARIAELERLLADRDRQIIELRAAVDALLQPDKPPTNIWDQFTFQKQDRSDTVDKT